MIDKVRGYEIKDEKSVKKEARKVLRKLHKMAEIDVKKLRDYVFSGMEDVNVKKPEGPEYVEVNPSDLNRRMYLDDIYHNRNYF